MHNRTHTSCRINTHTRTQSLTTDFESAQKQGESNTLTIRFCACPHTWAQLRSTVTHQYRSLSHTHTQADTHTHTLSGTHCCTMHIPNRRWLSTWAPASECAHPRRSANKILSPCVHTARTQAHTYTSSWLIPSLPSSTLYTPLKRRLRSALCTNHTLTNTTTLEHNLEYAKHL